MAQTGLSLILTFVSMKLGLGESSHQTVLTRTLWDSAHESLVSRLGKLLDLQVEFVGLAEYSTNPKTLDCLLLD